LKASVVIPVVAIVVLAAPAWLLWYGVSDSPTWTSEPGALTKQQLPTDLPPLFPESGAGGVRSAAPIYEQLLTLYQNNHDTLPRTPAYDKLVDQACELWIESASASVTQPDFLDHHIPIRIGTQPDYNDALERAYEDALMRAAELYQRGDTEQAVGLMQSVWVLGRRLFTGHVRLYHRVIGLDMMESAGGMLYDVAVMESGTPPGPISNDRLADLHRWSDAIRQIRQAWQRKMETIMHVSPHPGDLINIALHDEDRTFRIEATLRLGIHRYGASRGNRRLMEQAIQHAIDSDDPMWSQAGIAAQALTLEDKRRLF